MINAGLRLLAVTFAVLGPFAGGALRPFVRDLEVYLFLAVALALLGLAGLMLYANIERAEGVREGRLQCLRREG